MSGGITADFVVRVQRIQFVVAELLGRRIGKGVVQWSQAVVFRWICHKFERLVLIQGFDCSGNEGNGDRKIQQP